MHVHHLDRFPLSEYAADEKKQTMSAVSIDHGSDGTAQLISLPPR